MRTLVQKQFVIAAGLLAMPLMADVDLQPDRGRPAQADVRLLRLEHLLRKSRSPIGGMASDFLTAADNNGLDWRLLPSIALIESGCGKVHRNNNIFGWSNGNEHFPSIRAGIHIVASRLSHLRRYRGKSADEILSAYNPHPSYRLRVRAVMESLGSENLSASLLPLSVLQAAAN